MTDVLGMDYQREHCWLPLVPQRVGKSGLGSALLNNKVFIFKFCISCCVFFLYLGQFMVFVIFV